MLLDMLGAFILLWLFGFSITIGVPEVLLNALLPWTDVTAPGMC